MSLKTDRLALPQLAVAQAQKEATLNESLALLDAAVQPVVQSVAPATVPTTPSAGQCWIVGAGATGTWIGNDGALAIWTAGGWRFLAPFEGMQAWSVADSAPVRRAGSSWVIGVLKGQQLWLGGQQVVGAQQSAIGAPSGGATIDAEARGTIAAILAKMRAHGLIAV